MLDQLDDKEIDRLAAEHRKKMELERQAKEGGNTAPAPEPEPEEEEEMGFLDHLEVLRWHLVRSAIAVVAFAVAAFIFPEFVFGELLLGPSKADFWTYEALCKLGNQIGSDVLCFDINVDLQNRTMTGQFSAYFTVSLIFGFVASFPYVFWEIWRFIRPGLYNHEQQAARGTVFYVSVLFAIGVLFGYYVVAPMSVNFLTNFQIDPSIANQIDLSSYISTVAGLTFTCGLMFQMPVVSYFLARAGLLTAETMTQYRKHALVVSLFLAAVLTPPDVLSQVMLGAPLFGLYQLSIGIVRRVNKKDEEAVSS